MKILIVEDTAPIARAFKKILEDEGHKISVAGDGNAALLALEETDFELMLVDLMMPGMSGQELIEEISKQNIQTTILVTTNMGVGYDETYLRSLGVSQVLLKSHIGPKELRQLVNSYAS